MAGKKQSRRSPTFFEHLKRVLEAIDAPEQLGSQSPLAAPYFLGEALHGVEATAQARGLVLQREIKLTLESLWGGPLPDDGPSMLAAVEEDIDHSGRYDCLILELNYLRTRFRPTPRTQAEIYHEILHISRPTHDRHLRTAVERLGETLLLRLRPAIRPEAPVLPDTVIGRDTQLAELLHALDEGETVSLAGAGGVGKTTLGAAAVDRWPSPAVFWYTFRPAFNDQLENLLFALGHFLHGQGASTLWHQLVADGGLIKDVGLARGLAVGDLQSLAHRPLLCFDELDFLRPTELDQPRAQHVRLLEFLDSLRGEVPLLLIGQQAFWESDRLLTVDAFGEPELGQLLSAWDVPHTSADLAALFAYTAGNVRLAELCIALFQTGAADTLTTVVEQLPRAHALLPIWHRLARRLPDGERRLLYLLSVFRSPAPADAWREDEADAALANLVQRRLVQRDGWGGVALLPALRELIYGDQAIENREGHHLAAADIRSERGDYTDAAYHLAQAGQPEAAVALWYAHRQGEINRGQAGAALTLFSEISQRRLQDKRRKELLLLRSELYQLTGEPERVIEELGGESWSADDEESIDAALLRGKALDLTGRVEGARQQFGIGTAMATRLLDKLTRIIIQRSLSYLHERDMAAAWHEVRLASHHVAIMEGALHEQSGNLDEAWTQYQRALALAQTLDYRPGIAKVHLHLGTIAMRKLYVKEAIEQYNLSMDAYDALGDRVGREVVRSGMATVHLQEKQYLLAVEPAKAALAFFERMKDPFWIALNASNLAEAHVELHNYAAAEEYAHRALAAEEPHSHPYALWSLGRVRTAQTRFEEAHQFLNQAQAIAEQNQDSYVQAYICEDLGRLLLAQEETSAARMALADARQRFQELNIQPKADAIASLLGTVEEMYDA